MITAMRFFKKNKMNDSEFKSQIINEFQKSRTGAIMRCAEIVFDLGRKDLAKQIFDVTHIDRKKFEEIKTNILINK